MLSASTTIRRRRPSFCVDGRARSRPSIVPTSAPMMPGVPEQQPRRSSRRRRPVAAFDIADGTVVSRVRPEWAVECEKFFVAIDKAVPTELDVTWLDNVSSRRTPRSTTGSPNVLAPSALHPDRLLVAHPGRALVRSSSTSSCDVASTKACRTGEGHQDSIRPGTPTPGRWSGEPPRILDSLARCLLNEFRAGDTQILLASRRARLACAVWTWRTAICVTTRSPQICSRPHRLY